VVYETPADRMPLRELLLHLLEYTDSGVITELWPDTEITLDEIAGSILARDARELATKQRAAEAAWRQSGYAGTRSKGWLIDLIDPDITDQQGELS
jgi:hypothetical protein